jgi:hypothetical protein
LRFTSRTATGENLVTRIVVGLFAAYMMLGQRFTVSASTGGRGVISPLEILFVAAALTVGLALLDSRGKPRYPGVWIATVGPLFGLLMALPLWGVVIGAYDPRALYSWMVVLIPLSIIITVRAANRKGINLDRVAFLAIAVHGLYGLGQMLARLEILPASMWTWASDWDAASQGAYSDQYLVYGRSTGLFINANVFGLWSVLALVFAAVRLRGAQRAVAIPLALLGVLGSQSRTAWACVAVVAVAGMIAALRRPGVASRAGLWAFWLAPLLAVAALLGIPQKLVEATASTRLASGLSVISDGASGDANLLGRTDAWSAAEDFASTQYPLGTLGPPQTYFTSFIDNQYVSFYLQGTVVLVLAFILALLGPIALWRRGVADAPALAVMAACVALASLTMQPLDVPVSLALVWMLAAQALDKDPERTSGEQHELAVADGLRLGR